MKLIDTRTGLEVQLGETIKTFGGAEVKVLGYSESDLGSQREIKVEFKGIAFSLRPMDCFCEIR